MEYVKKTPSSGTAKTGLGLGIAGTALGGLALLGNGNNGGILGNLFGAPNANNALATETGLLLAMTAMNGGLGGCHHGHVPAPVAGGSFVTEKEMGLIRENAGKDAVIARLEAERYADRLVEARTESLNNRICALETATAVNTARDTDFRRFVEREYVHQPKASIRESIVVCKQCGCECAC